jgi:hypothetical protein
MGEDGRVLRRVLLIFVAVLLLVSVLGGLAPRDDEATKPDLPRSARTPVDTVRGTLPRDEVVRAQVGDLVELTVTAEQVDSATIEALGLTEALAPQAPARFSFLADRAGSFPVTLTLTDDRAGRVVVTEAQDGAAEAGPAAR